MRTVKTVLMILMLEVQNHTMLILVKHHILLLQIQLTQCLIIMDTEVE